MAVVLSFLIGFMCSPLGESSQSSQSFFEKKTMYFGATPSYVFTLESGTFDVSLWSLFRSDSYRSLSDLVSDEAFILAAPATMYQRGGAPISYLRYNEETYQHQFRPGYGGLLVFQPNTNLSESLPAVDIIDLENVELAKNYSGAISLMRMIYQNRPLVWKGSYAGTVVLGVTNLGDVVVIFTPDKMKMEVLISGVLNSDLDIEKMVYLEGGSRGRVSYKTLEGVQSLGSNGILPYVLRFAHH